MTSKQRRIHASRNACEASAKFLDKSDLLHRRPGRANPQQFLDVCVRAKYPRSSAYTVAMICVHREYLHDASDAYQQHLNFFTTNVWSEQISSKQDLATRCCGLLVFPMAEYSPCRWNDTAGKVLRSDRHFLAAAGRFCCLQRPGILPPISPLRRIKAEMKFEEHDSISQNPEIGKGLIFCLQVRDASHGSRFGLANFASRLTGTPALIKRTRIHPDECCNRC